MRNIRKPIIAFWFAFVFSVASLMGLPNPGQAHTELASPALDTSLIETVLGMKGAFQKGEYKITVPQNDLAVVVDGFRIVPFMGLGSWAAFTPAAGGAMVMGDLVLLETEIGPVQRVIVSSGLKVTGLHNHFVRDRPKVMFMHIHGMGGVERLAGGVRAALDKIKELRTAAGLKSEPSRVESTFDSKKIDAIIGHGGEANAGVYKITIGRPDIALKDMGAPVSTFMGFNTWMAFQGTADRAAVAGDFAMLEAEVEHVIGALVNYGIEVVAVHNHMTTENPKIVFLHFWGIGPVEQLCRGLKAGLDQTGRPRN